MRKATSIAGETQPICAKVGSKPMVKVANPMKTMVIMNVCLRPSVSPSRPNSRAPKGRTMKPIA